MEHRQDVSVVCLHDVLLERHNDVSKERNNDAPSLHPRRLEQVLNETPNDISVVRYQDVSVVRIHDVPLARLYDVSCKSQIKHPKTLLWHVSTKFLRRLVSGSLLHIQITLS